MDRSMKRAARAFAVIALAVAKDLHDRGVDLGGVEQQRILDEANRAMFEHEVEVGAPVEAVRSLSGLGWCGLIRLNGQLVTMHGLIPIGRRPVVRRPVSCRRCRQALLGVV